MFAGLGIWLGVKLTGRPERVVVREVSVPTALAFVRDERRREALGITPRELEILELIAEGLSNKEVARRLGISAHTVKFHLEAIFEKLGATTRADAVARGLRGGLILL